MKIFVITGPSGVGKSHLISELSLQGIHSLAVYTDRKRRPTEMSISDRVYISAQDFTALIDDFLYWFEFQGYRYGYKIDDITNAMHENTSIALSIPLSQLPKLMKKLPEGHIIFLDIDSGHEELLKARMIKRDISHSDSKESKNVKIKMIERRIRFYKVEQKKFASGEFSFLNNTKHRRFLIQNDHTLYDEVIPYILHLNNS